MAEKHANSGFVFIFDPTPTNSDILDPDATHPDLKWCDQQLSNQTDSKTSRHDRYVHLQLRHLFSWLTLNYEAQNRDLSLLPAAESLNSTYIGADFPNCTRKVPSNNSKAPSPPSSSIATQSTMHVPECIEGGTSVVVVRITADLSPSVTWTTQFCGLILSSKLSVCARLEYAKAVNSTLGGAYATLQRAGWARLYAKKQLRLALASGDETLALRANVYLKICEITALLHPSHSRRIVIEDDKVGHTTKTDTNVHASDAHLLSQSDKIRLKAELRVLEEQTVHIDDASISGLIKYAKFRIDTN